MGMPHKISEQVGDDYFVWVALAHVEKSHIVEIGCFEAKLFVWKLCYKCILAKTGVDEPFCCCVSFLVIMGMHLINTVDCTNS